MKMDEEREEIHEEDLGIKDICRSCGHFRDIFAPIHPEVDTECPRCNAEDWRASSVTMAITGEPKFPEPLQTPARLVFGRYAFTTRLGVVTDGDDDILCYMVDI